MALNFSARTPGMRHVNYAKRMSTHLAAALVSFAVLQIVVVAKLGGSLALHLGIVVAIGGFALAARELEHRWALLGSTSLPAAGLTTRFRIDLLQLWGASLLAPLLWVPVATVARFLFG